MCAFTEPFTESFTESDTERSLPDQGAWIREQGTRDLRDEVPIHLQTVRALRAMDGCSAAIIGGGC